MQAPISNGISTYSNILPAMLLRTVDTVYELRCTLNLTYLSYLMWSVAIVSINMALICGNAFRSMALATALTARGLRPVHQTRRRADTSSSVATLLGKHSKKHTNYAPKRKTKKKRRVARARRARARATRRTTARTRRRRPRPPPRRPRRATRCRRCERLSSPAPRTLIYVTYMFRFKSTIVFIIRR